VAQTKTQSSRSSNARNSKRKSSSSSGSRSRGGSTTRKATQSGRSTTQSGRRQTGSSNGSAIRTFAEKAKGPALAGGAALAGLAGGMALTRKRQRGGVLARVPTPKLKAPSVKLPKPDAMVKAVGTAAGQVADGSHRVGQVAAQVQRASEAIDGQNSSRSRSEYQE
jgi:hypothetical protein